MVKSALPTAPATNWKFVIVAAICATAYATWWFWPQSTSVNAADPSTPQNEVPVVVDVPPPTMVKDNRTIDQILKDYVAHHPDPQSAAAIINFDIQLPIADRAAAIADLNHKAAKANYEIAKYHTKTQQLGEEGASALVDKSVETVTTDANATPRFPIQPTTTGVVKSEQPPMAIPTIHDFRLRGVSQVANSTQLTAHLAVREHKYNVKNSDILFSKYTVYIANNGAVSICDGDDCQRIY